MQGRDNNDYSRGNQGPMYSNHVCQDKQMCHQCMTVIEMEFHCICPMDGQMIFVLITTAKIVQEGA